MKRIIRDTLLTDDEAAAYRAIRDQEDKEWAKEFKGKCISCRYSSPTNLKHKMTCHNAKALTHGCGAKAWGGGEAKGIVHKLFGCVYWEQF